MGGVRIACMLAATLVSVINGYSGNNVSANDDAAAEQEKDLEETVEEAVPAEKQQQQQLSTFNPEEVYERLLTRTIDMLTYPIDQKRGDIYDEAKKEADKIKKENTFDEDLVRKAYETIKLRIKEGSELFVLDNIKATRWLVDRLHRDASEYNQEILDELYNEAAKCLGNKKTDKERAEAKRDLAVFFAETNNLDIEVRERKYQELLKTDEE